MQKLFVGMVLSGAVLANGLAGCAPSIANKFLPAITSVPTPKVVSSGSFPALEQSVYQQINQYRQSRNLPALKLDSRISEQARAHSQAMANGRVPFSHQGFDQRVKAISSTIPYQEAAENVAYNQGYQNPDRQAVEGWIKSSGHRHNIQGNYNLTGIGIVKNAQGEYYFTQIFIRSW